MKVALGIEYSGENYCGWQRQSHSPSVQQHVEESLTKIAAQPIKVYCAGRTDTGVHATGQVIHFEMQGSRPKTAWLRGANNYLPNDISIVWSTDIDDSFHARFSALSRRYRYVIQNTTTPSATLSGKVTWHRNELDIIAMQKAADLLKGRHDFSSFRASSCQANTAIREIERITIQKRNSLIFIDITANAFLHHMVRNIVGCLFQIGEHRQEISFIDTLLQIKDRTKAPDTAKPDGLYLVNVEYPKEFNLPKAVFQPLGFSID